MMKLLLRCAEILFFATLVSFTYWFALDWIMEPLKLHSQTPLLSNYGFAAIIGFNVIWVLLMIGPIKNVHIRIFLTLLVLALSAALLTDMYFIAFK